MPELWPVFEKLSKPVATIDDTDILERFIVLAYTQTLSCSKVNDARKHLFGLGIRQIETIPPSQSSLTDHFK